MNDDTFVPRSRAVEQHTVLGVVVPKRPLKRTARSRVSSRCWRWSSPTGTWSAW